MARGDVYDVTIIGAGCAGLFAANYAGLRGMKTKIIDYLPKTGGCVSVFYPEKTIYDIGGIPQINGQKLMDQLLEQATMYEPTLVLEQEVQSMERKSDGTYVLTTNKGERHFTKTVILAIGAGAYKIRHLRINNEFLEEGEHIHYEPSDLETFSGKRVLVYGGLSAAVKRATDLSKLGAQVVLVHNSETFNALDEEMDELRRLPITVKSPYHIKDVYRDHDAVKEVLLYNAKSDLEERVAIDDMIISHGYNFDLEAIKGWGFTLENRRIPVSEKMETKFAGIYAAGDIAGYANKWRLISSAFTEAITAVNSAKKFIDPSAPAQVYSTVLRK